MPTRQDLPLTVRFQAKCAETRRLLRGHMEERGLYESDGWSIHESVRSREGVTELVMRPLHMRLPPPDDLECVVRIDAPTLQIDSECEAGEPAP